MSRSGTDEEEVYPNIMKTSSNEASDCLCDCYLFTAQIIHSTLFDTRLLSSLASTTDCVLSILGTPSVHIPRGLTRTTHCRYKSEADSKAQLSSTFTSPRTMFLHHYHPSRRSQHFESTHEQDLFANQLFVITTARARV